MSEQTDQWLDMQTILYVAYGRLYLALIYTSWNMQKLNPQVKISYIQQLPKIQAILCNEQVV